jgi:hypothetical protein
MEILFQTRNGINEFRIRDLTSTEDLETLRSSLFKFYETAPVFTILDLTANDTGASPSGLTGLIEETKSLASSKGLHFKCARNPSELDDLRRKLVETALEEQMNMLEARLELREKMRMDAERLLEENRNLRMTVEQELKRIDRLGETSPWFGSFAKKLWSERNK